MNPNKLFENDISIRLCLLPEIQDTNFFFIYNCKVCIPKNYGGFFRLFAVVYIYNANDNKA